MKDSPMTHNLMPFAAAVLASAFALGAVAADGTSTSPAQSKVANDRVTAVPAQPTVFDDNVPPAAGQRAGADDNVPPSLVHAKLAEFAGTYDVSGTFWSPANNASIPLSGTARLRMILDGKFLQETIRGDKNGHAFTGLGLTGFNTSTKRFTSTWVSTEGTSTMIMRGKAKPGNQLILCGVFRHPVTGQRTRIRSVTTAINSDEFRRELFAKRGSEEKKVMELTYRRRK